MAYFIGSTLLCVNYLTTPKYASFDCFLSELLCFIFTSNISLNKHTFVNCSVIIWRDILRYIDIWVVIVYFFHVICFTSKCIMDYFILSLCPWCLIHIVDTHEYVLIFQDCLSMLKQSFICILITMSELGVWKHAYYKYTWFLSS